jgi:phosphate transport system protein
MALHTDRAYEAELLALRDRLVDMVGQVEQMVIDAVKAVTERDGQLARETIRQDRRVNRAEVEIDEMCMLLLARRQPVASDLRLVTTALKMVTDIERIGDVAVNLCERAIDLAGEPAIPAIDGPLNALGQLAAAMLREAIEAFATRDAEKAEHVLHMDDDADEQYHQIVRALAQRIRDNPDKVEQNVALQSAAKQLERVGDHATNLAEQVILLVRGQDLRHQGKLA